MDQTVAGNSSLRFGSLGLAVALVFAVAGCKDGDGAQAAPAAAKAADAIPVETVAVGRRAIAASYVGTAPLEPLAESQVVAKTSGVALAVLVEEGQTVRAGQVLVRLDPDRATLQAAQSSAQLRKLEANFKRSEQLERQQLVSAADHDQLRYDLENARAINRLANLELGYSNVVSPISGVVASRDIKPGNFVQINSPIFRVVDASRLEATLNVPEREIAKLAAGQTVVLVADALPGKRFTGVVARVAPVVDNGTGTFRVVVAFDGGEGLQPGMFGRISIHYDSREDALVVPRNALLEDGGEPAVYAVRDGKASRVVLRLGYAEGGWVEVREGLKQGDAVVVAGKAALREGSPVQVIGAGKADTPAKPASGGAADAKAPR